jgi:hypothetical protein
VLDSPRRREQEVGEKDPEAYFCVSLSGSSDRDAGRGSTLDPVPEMADGDEMGVGLQLVPRTPERDTPTGGPPLEDQSFARIKSFCAKILKTLAPPLFSEIESTSQLSTAAVPFTPRRVTRHSAAMGAASTPKLSKKASQAETVLLKALGITPSELAVNEEDLSTFRRLFDSPLKEQHLRAIAAIFGKKVPCVPVGNDACAVLVAAN